jgi:hypothetical protein
LLAPCQPGQFADGTGLGGSDQRQQGADGMCVMTNFSTDDVFHHRASNPVPRPKGV